MNSLSVVIPTKDRVAALARTLAGLEAQDVGDARVEVLVVDNGSSDGTVARARDLAAGAATPIRLLEHPEGGPAAARNAAVAAASGEVLLFLGDDTEPAEPGLLRAHLDLHGDRPEDSYGVLGHITWSPRNAVTPFMRWLENGGPQFHYGEIEPGPVDAATYFYSSHASLKRSLFERLGGFDERFPTAAVEDTELGVRLADAGLELDYHPELLVLHDHPTTPAQSLRRSVAVGRSAALYNRLRPERPHPGVQAPRGFAWSAVRAAAPLLGILARLPLPRGTREHVWLAMTRAGYARGYRMGPVEAR
jgi:glycosyltransferase involved in cell wall biosynthesis